MAECRETLERALSELEEFSARMVEGRLVIYGSAGRIDFIFTAECTDEGGMLLISGYPGFFNVLPRGDAGRAVLEKVLELAGSQYVLASKMDENLVVSEPAPIEPDVDAVKRFFSLTALVAVWLDKQIERAEKGEELVPFSVEEAAKLIQGGEE